MLLQKTHSEIIKEFSDLANRKLNEMQVSKRPRALKSEAKKILQAVEWLKDNYFSGTVQLKINNNGIPCVGECFECIVKKILLQNKTKDLKSSRLKATDTLTRLNGKRQGLEIKTFIYNAPTPISNPKNTLVYLPNAIYLIDTETLKEYLSNHTNNRLTLGFVTSEGYEIKDKSELEDILSWYTED